MSPWGQLGPEWGLAIFAALMIYFLWKIKDLLADLLNELKGARSEVRLLLDIAKKTK